MDIVRKVLITAEEPPKSNWPGGIKSIEGVPEDVAAYHVALLKDAGFVEAIVDNNPDGLPYRFQKLRMTWAGHEFLDAARDDTIWKKVKEHVIAPGASWTVSLLFEYLKAEIRTRLKLPPSP